MENFKTKIEKQAEKCTTKAQLAALKETATDALKQNYKENCLNAYDEMNCKLADLREITARRHDEISEENRQQWSGDRERMWIEVCNTTTATTLAEILRAALVRGIITEYHVTAADGDSLDGQKWN